MNHRNYDKENNIDRQTYYNNSNRLESRSSVDIDISTLKIGHSKNANNREDRSTSQPNSRNSHINLEEGKSRSKSKGRSNSARRLQNRPPQQPQSQPQQPQTKQLVEDSNNNSNERGEFTSSNKTHSLSSAGGNRNGNGNSSTNDMNSYSTSQKSSFKSSSSGPGSERNPSHHHRPSAYHHHQPHSRGGYNAPPPAYNFNPTQHYMAPGPYFNTHIPPQINSAAGYGSGFNNSNNVPIYPTIEIHLTVRDHELFAAKQREACPSRPSSSIFRSAAPSPSSSPSKFNSHCRSEQPSHGPDSEEADLQKLLEQTWAETDEMLCDQRDNLMQFYEAVKQAQIARCARCLNSFTQLPCSFVFGSVFFLIQYCIMHNNIGVAVGEVLFLLWLTL